MSEPISYVGREAAKRIVLKAKEKFSPIIHTHTKSDITDLIVDSELSSNSTNPVQNKVILNAIEEINENSTKVSIVRWS